MEFVLAAAPNTLNNEAQSEWRICSLLLLCVFVTSLCYSSALSLISAESIVFILFGSHAGRPSLNRNGWAGFKVISSECESRQGAVRVRDTIPMTDHTCVNERMKSNWVEGVVAATKSKGLPGCLLQLSFSASFQAACQRYASYFLAAPTLLHPVPH